MGSIITSEWLQSEADISNTFVINNQLFIIIPSVAESNMVVYTKVLTCYSIPSAYVWYAN